MRAAMKPLSAVGS